MLALQMFLDEPNINSPAQQEAYKLFKSDTQEYKRRVKDQVSCVEQL